MIDQTIEIVVNPTKQRGIVGNLIIKISDIRIVNYFDKLIKMIEKECEFTVDPSSIVYKKDEYRIAFNKTLVFDYISNKYLDGGRYRICISLSTCKNTIIVEGEEFEYKYTKFSCYIQTVEGTFIRVLDLKTNKFDLIMGLNDKYKGAGLLKIFTKAPIDDSKEFEELLKTIEKYCDGMKIIKDDYLFDSSGYYNIMFEQLLCSNLGKGYDDNIMCIGVRKSTREFKVCSGYKSFSVEYDCFRGRLIEK